MSDMNSMIWLLDDHEIRRMAIAGFLSTWAKSDALNICPIKSEDAIGAADHGNQSCEICILATGGVSLADPDLAGRIRNLIGVLAGRPLAIFSDLDSDAEVSAAIALGAHGLISTSMSGSFAIAAFGFILMGGTCFKQSALASLALRANPSTTRQDLASWSPSIPLIGTSTLERSKVTQMLMAPANTELSPLTDITDLPHLTQRQSDIVEMLKLGRSNKEIARQLDISDATVKIFVRQVMKKYGAINRTQVALMASEAMSPRDARHGPVTYAAGGRSN
jgi:DNA-binding NarL/FixJ family response regulator